MLSQPTKTKMAGPKVIRVETPDVIPAPRSRTGPRTTTPPMRGGAPRTGRGPGVGAPDTDATGRDRGGPGSRRNKRRSGAAAEEPGRTARSGHFASAADDRPFNWREQDLLERENRLNRAGGFFKQARRDNLTRQTGGGHKAVVPAEAGGKVKIQTPISVKDLSAATGIKVSDILKKLLLSGKMVTVN